MIVYVLPSTSFLRAKRMTPCCIRCWISGHVACNLLGYSGVLGKEKFQALYATVENERRD